MDAYGALAAKVGALLIFKAPSLNGKLHCRCLSVSVTRSPGCKGDRVGMTATVLRDDGLPQGGQQASRIGGLAQPGAPAKPITASLRAVVGARHNERNAPRP